MIDGFLMFSKALWGFLVQNPVMILYVLGATQLGIIVGMLPGLTATMGVALMTTLTFKMAPDSAVLILVCMYVGAIYGGSRSAILLNIPGTPANAATAVDGYPLARQGLAGKAIGIATTGSFLGSVIGLLLLATIAMFVLGLSMVRPLVKVLAIRRARLMPVVFVLCVIGSYAIQARLFDIDVMVVFGIVGYFMREMDYPIAPLVLGIILGTILDKNLIRSLIISEGNPLFFFQSPISQIIASVTLLTFFSRTRWFQALKSKIGDSIKNKILRMGKSSRQKLV